jgi:peptidoglycan-N-acetylglucosamine deacetylase
MISKGDGSNEKEVMRLRKRRIKWKSFMGVAAFCIAGYYFTHPFPASSKANYTVNVENKDKMKIPQIINKLPDGLALGKMIGVIHRPQKLVYLTFDDGPSHYTESIADVLAKNKIQASFFWIGNHLSNGEVAQKLILEGDIIGTHTMNHAVMEHHTLSEQVDMIKKTTDYISKKIGQPVLYFRPPYGAVDENTLKASQITGQILTYWTVDSEDWKYPANPKKILANIDREVKPGSIILMHEKPQTVAVLQQVIDLLKQKGYHFAPLPTPGMSDHSLTVNQTDKPHL